MQQGVPATYTVSWSGLEPGTRYLGVVGYGVALLFLLHGAPDLALTQVLVETITLVVFVIWELTDKDPIVNLRLFRHRNFRAGTMAHVVGAVPAVVIPTPRCATTPGRGTTGR